MKAQNSIKFARSHSDLDNIVNQSKGQYKNSDISINELQEILQLAWNQRKWVR